jgi:hypothetical protein
VLDRRKRIAEAAFDAGQAQLQGLWVAAVNVARKLVQCEDERHRTAWGVHPVIDFATRRSLQQRGESLAHRRIELAATQEPPFGIAYRTLSPVIDGTEPKLMDCVRIHCASPAVTTAKGVLSLSVIAVHALCFTMFSFAPMQSTIGKTMPKPGDKVRVNLPKRPTMSLVP